MRKPKQAAQPILSLPEPCHVAWDTMHDAMDSSPRRYCDSCEKHVHDLSAMTKQEAMALLEANDWNICVNYEVNEDGEMLFQPEPPSRFMQQLQGAQKLLATAALITPLAFIQAACDDELRTGGEPIPVAQSVESTDPSTQGSSTQGAGLAPTLAEEEDDTTPACDTPEAIEEATDEVESVPVRRHGGEAKPVWKQREDEEQGKVDVSNLPHLDRAPPQRLGGAPRALEIPTTSPPPVTKDAP